MRRRRSDAEILFSNQPITKTEFGRISGYKGRHLDRAYKIAVDKDQTELEGRLIFTAGDKIRIESACWVMGTTLAQLQKTYLNKIKADGLAHQSATD